LDDVLITGLGIVSPIGIGRDAVWRCVESRRSGITAIDEFAKAGWLAPYGGQVVDFDAKEYVKPRKSLKVMAHEIQFAFGAAELAAADAGLEEGSFDPDRAGVVLGAGTMYCDLDELIDAYRACAGASGFDFSKWGDQAARQLFPLWMLKYLPNMPACHIGIRHDARGPTNTITHGDVSSLLALGEAADVIRRGQADVMFAGGTSSRLDISDLLWHGGARLAQTTAPPESICRPFDAKREGMVMGEGAALFVLENAQHAKRRGARALAKIVGVASRNQATGKKFAPPGEAIASALATALDQAHLNPADLSHINAHGASTSEDDPVEAAAIASVLHQAEVPITAPKSYFGNLGAGSGAVELAISLLAAEHGLVPATLNHEQTASDCPVCVASEHLPANRPAFAVLNHTSTGQAVAAIFVRE
jgi:3-oxoacyl-[acyl-carrier-protein] synthase II